MHITDDLVRTLLYRCESEALDFKREQYKVSENHGKVEFIKDRAINNSCFSSPVQ
jgi:hypothetical protein